MTDTITLPRINYAEVQAYCEKNRTSFNETCAMVRAALAAPQVKCPHGLFDVCCESPDDCSLRAAPQGEPVIRAQFECDDGELIGTTSAQVKRVEVQDDGSYTVVIDHWPTPQPAPTLEPLSEDQIWDMRKAAKADPQCEKEHWFILLVRMVEAAHAAKLKGGA